MKALKPRVAWVTGASSGIGRAISLLLAEQGWRVIASARNASALDQLAKQVNDDSTQTAGSIVPLPIDVGEDSLMDLVAGNTSNHFNGLSLCVICAGHCEYVDDVAEPDMALYQRVFQTNFFGAVRTVAAAIPHLQATAAGGERSHLVITTSLSNVVGFSRAEAYGSSKAALEYYANALRLDLNDKNIDVTAVSPGFVETPMTDKNDFAMPFILSCDQAARRIVNAIEKRPLVYRFPKRLWLLLSTFAHLPLLWYRYVGLRLSRR